MNQTSRILEEVKKAVCGKDRVLVWVLTVLLAREADARQIGPEQILAEILRQVPAPRL